MDNEILHIRAGMTEEEVIQCIAASMWEESNAATRQHLQALAGCFGYDDVRAFLCQYVRAKRQQFPTLDAWLETLPGLLDEPLIPSHPSCLRTGRPTARYNHA